jgi:hypothetical protein
MFEHQVPKPLEKAVAAKAEEALGLLALIKPLCKKAGKLTPAEQEVLLKAVSEADNVLSNAMNAVWESRAQAIRQKDTSAAVRPT